ncbi:MAG: aldo/keto reductase [Bacteroidetes bacterium]|nr:aldo/keto reductase [Bacteroidota bacterium]
MKYRYLGNSGLKVSEICLGVMTFNGGKQSEIGSVDQHEANEIVEVALDNGINFFDTADVYSNGISEEILGKALGKRRNEAILATKVRFPMDKGVNNTGLSRYHIIESCEASLKRLGTDHIDLYQIHGYDKGTPLEETLRALDELLSSGKVRYIGCSNLSAWHTMKALAISEKLGLEKFITTQLYYSIGVRDIEHELVPLCLDQHLGILCWSPLSGGFFTGKFRRESDGPANARRSHKDAYSLKFWALDEEKGYQILDALDVVAGRMEKSVSQLALGWLLHQPAVTSVIVGARNKKQLLENLSASGLMIAASDIALLNSASAPVIPYPQSHQLTSDPR